MHHYTPECKQVNTERLKPGEAAPQKVKTRLSAGKIGATFFGVAEAHCSLIFSTNGVQLMLRTTANYSMK